MNLYSYKNTYFPFFLFPLTFSFKYASYTGTHIFDACMTILTFLYFTFCHENLFINSQIEFVSSEQRCSICPLS